MLEDINFEFDSARLTAEAKRTLDMLVPKLKARPGLVVRIDGYTDSVGKSDYNLELSRRRAESVRDYLTGRGISRNRFEVQGHGENFPVDSNDTESGRARNRRVVIYLLE